MERCCNKCFPDRKNFSVIVSIPKVIKGGKCNPKCPFYYLNSLYTSHCTLGLAEDTPVGGGLFPGKRCPRYVLPNR